MLMLLSEPTEVPPNFKIFIVYKVKSLPRFGGRLAVGFFLCFTPQGYLPPEIIPVVVVVVIMVLLIIISVMPVK